MAAWECVVPGAARAKGRPRVTGQGTFTPAPTMRWEAQVRAAFMALHGAPRTGRRVAVAIEFTRRGVDVDNVAKAICDALNGVAYLDDGQVDELLVRRCPVGRGQPQFARVRVEEIA